MWRNSSKPNLNVHEVLADYICMYSLLFGDALISGLQRVNKKSPDMNKKGN